MDSGPFHLLTPFQYPRCSHTAEHFTPVCRHIFFDGVEDGCKQFLGQGWDCQYQCEACAEEKLPVTCELCPTCIALLEATGYWQVEGEPGINRQPCAFQFQARELGIDASLVTQMASLTPLPHHPSDAILITQTGELWRANLLTGQTHWLCRLESEQAVSPDRHRVVISDDQQLLAVTIRNNHDKATGNSGMVLDLQTGKHLMPLDAGTYHMEQADFPVTFIEHRGRTLVIHATDWNHLDITDPRTGQCLTQRQIDSAPPFGRDDALFTEWYGALKVSPDRRRIATIGWVWHPVGIAFSWDLQHWLEKNPWEADFGGSKRLYADWEYFWHGPFFWRDNKTLAIWGAPELQTSRDIPLDSVALYDAESEQQVGLIYGPAIEPFYYDTYLFTGLPQDHDSPPGIAVWCLQEGALLYEQPDIAPIAYHPGLKMFIERRNEQLIGWHWQCLS